MAIGDVTSNARGSGARYNDGKLPLDLVPVRYWAWAVGDEGLAGSHYPLNDALSTLAAFQMGDEMALRELLEDIGLSALVDATRVFEYGARKYATWNWAKGMPWSVPTGCILRHAVAMADGELVDPESGLPHWGHIVCNLIMLDWYLDNYPEGDDRPPVLRITDADYPPVT